MTYRKWKETKVQPGTAGPGNMLGCSLVSFHFRWAILCPQPVCILQVLSVKAFEVFEKAPTKALCRDSPSKDNAYKLTFRAVFLENPKICFSVGGKNVHSFA